MGLKKWGRSRWDGGLSVREKKVELVLTAGARQSNGWGLRVRQDHLVFQLEQQIHDLPVLGCLSQGRVIGL